MKASFPLPNASVDLTGQVALVTGASSGLGRRFALALAATGASVAVAARRMDRLRDLVAEIEGNGGTAVAVSIDLTDHGSLVAGVDQAESALGLVTILVNNAGIPDAQRAHLMPVDLIDAVINTNLRGPFILACEVGRRLIAAKRPGRIVNISSAMAFHYGGEAASLYSITKAAVNRMTEVLAVEWVRHGINVNAIAPGYFTSEMTDGMVQRMGSFAQSFPRKRMGDPAQLDSTLLYMVAPSSELVTGAVLRVDDGQLPR
jgi:NAD(P)-dependent dehydrogenase (short-subunit alcohol dehydrogenase family)